MKPEGLDPNVSVDESCWTSEELCLKRETCSSFICCRLSLPPLLRVTVFAVVSLLKVGEAERLKMFSSVGYVHIDDVALCHILLFENENARGRYICNAKVLDIGELVSILAPRFPTLPIAKRSAFNYVQIEKFDASYYDYNSSKVKSLGMKFKSIEDMFDDCVVSLVEQGHLALV
ncbi:hypothetical protein Leryth_002249 [Lithospermum erythrorhizon]|nr:hypothetical protein Leryth_002249 [Lithospermum erythrorhizon]